jgi:hypothetical protein
MHRPRKEVPRRPAKTSLHLGVWDPQRQCYRLACGAPDASATWTFGSGIVLVDCPACQVTPYYLTKKGHHNESRT